MNHLTKAIETARTTLIETIFKEDGNFTVSCLRCTFSVGKPLRAAVITEPRLRQILSSSHTAILEALEKEIEEMKVLLHIDEKRGDDIGVKEGWGNGYNVALKDILALIKEAKEVIS